ncbi:Asp-tRNA(Asn)/Glu-tRNA(Gln) amidotransferase subunit GatA [Candidatus Saccharibacteria bacterium]|nr:Asp-tRNA(Asn)/Glu-tRNA(Gln) amidotransferase subunit GatA [Candidatus Saccharibacteria bacterium]MCB9821617.1 Asp-tRNA(Asn)/Glu-tRNA(Gln) amidotransferase subunit GatA [Candidatus Nomurabacteria bacterium]
MNRPQAIKEIVYQVQSGQLKAVDLAKVALEKAKNSQDYNVFLEICEADALKRAAEIDTMIEAGKDPGELAGVPFAIKDNFLVNFGHTTAASNMLKGFSSPYTATAVQKVLDAGGVLIGKVNLDAFAHGTTTENSDFGQTKNPHDPTKVPGGSSGGSAAAVALDIVPFALGSDTGGSIRLPASFCGVVGYKPSYGLVSRYGVVAMASSTDCIGVLGNSVENTATVMNIIKGQDEFDGTTIDSSEIDLTPSRQTKLNIGVIKEFAEYDLEPAAKKAFNEYLDVIKSLGHELVEVSIPSIELALACYYILVPAEVSSNLSRYDGVVYGHKSKDSKKLDEAISLSRSAGFGAENKRRIMIGTYVLSSGYYDAYYKKAQQLRTKLIEEFKTALEQANVLVCPVAPFAAFDLGAKIDDPVQMYLADIMTVLANLVGAPAISLPGKSVNQLPYGLQLISGHKEDGLIMSLAASLEEKL